jgi:outer membrane protein TolC
LGYRRSQVRAAGLAANRAGAEITLTRLDVSTFVIEASLALLGEEQRVKVAQADVDRRAVFAKSVHARVDAHLRPGADASRADAELATATTGLYLAQESLQVGRANLAELLGLTGTQVEIEPGPFLILPTEANLPALPPASHPAAIVEQDRVEEVEGRIRVLNHAYYPHFTLEALTSARGSGENSKGKIAAGWNGLGADVHNWEAGLTASLPLTDFAGLRERKKVEQANLRREQALYGQTLQNLAGEQAKAEAGLEWARRVAENTPIQLKAAQESEAQARARFQAGLGTIVDVAEAQRLLVQAETDDALARLAVWRALAGVAAARGDLSSFFDLAQHVPAGGP